MADDNRKPLLPREDFVRYLRDHVIPELRSMKLNLAVEDFELALRFIEDEDRRYLPQAPAKLVN